MKRWLMVLLVIVLLGSFAYAEFNEFIDTPPKPALNPGQPIKSIDGKKPDDTKYTKAEFLQTLERGCDQLIRWQHTDGGWSWPENFSTTDTATAANQKGVIARALVLLDGIIPGKDYIGDGSYPGARFTGEILFAIPDSSGYYAPDMLMMCELSEKVGDLKYKQRAQNHWAWRKINRAGYATGQQFAEMIVEKRCYGMWGGASVWGYSLCMWDLAGYVAAAEAMGDHTWAQQALDTILSTYAYPKAPGKIGLPKYDPAEPFPVCLPQRMIERWDDFDVATSGTKSVEASYVATLGNMLFAMNMVDSARYRYWIDLFTQKLTELQVNNLTSPHHGGWTLWKYGWGSDAQDSGYAMMGLRNVGAAQTGQKATQWAINNQEKIGNWSGLWRYIALNPPYNKGDSYQEGNAEILQGLFEIQEAENKPWVTIVSDPVGGHENYVPLSFRTHDLDNQPVSIKVEWSENDGVTWTETSNIQGAVTGLASTPGGVVHDIIWVSVPDLGFLDKTCKLRVTARRDTSPTGWGSPAGVTDYFTIINSTVPVELSVFEVK